MNEVIIKSIRKQKGLTQKEVYSGIASKTFYSDFEAGKHSVEVTKFQGFLNNLGISQAEFDYFRDSQIIMKRRFSMLRLINCITAAILKLYTKFLKNTNPTLTQ